MGSERNLKDAPLVVVVGGGYGGMQAAMLLEATFNVLVLEARDALYHTLGAIRGMCDEEIMKKLMIPYTNTLQLGGRVAKAKVARITPDAVFVEGREEPIPFDYLVIATGVSHRLKALRPLEHSKADMLGEAKKMYTKISEAEKIVLVGGGALGCEAAGEILRSFPEKDVTLVARRKHVLMSSQLNDELGREFEKRALGLAESNGYKLKILTERSVKLDEYKEGDSHVLTDKDEKLECDLMIMCSGNAPHDGGVFDGVRDSVDEDTGLLKVEPTLQLEGHKNVFVLGDVAKLGAVRTMRQAIWQARHVSANIKAMHAGRPLADYTRAGDDIQMITFGEWTGVSVVKNYYLTQRMGWAGHLLARQVMGRDVAVSGRWRAMRADKTDPNPKYEIDSLDADHVQAMIKQCAERRKPQSGLEEGSGQQDKADSNGAIKDGETVEPASSL